MHICKSLEFQVRYSSLRRGASLTWIMQAIEASKLTLGFSKIVTSLLEYHWCIPRAASKKLAIFQCNSTPLAKFMAVFCTSCKWAGHDWPGTWSMEEWYSCKGNVQGGKQEVTSWSHLKLVLHCLNHNKKPEHVPLWCTLDKRPENVFLFNVPPWCRSDKRPEHVCAMFLPDAHQIRDQSVSVQC